MKGGIKILNEMVNWEIVKNRRIKLDLTQKDMADKLGLTNQNVYSFYERDKVKKINEEIVEKIAVILELPMDEITKSTTQIVLDAYTDNERNFISSKEGQQSIKKFIYDHQVYQAGLKYLETLKKK